MATGRAEDPGRLRVELLAVPLDEGDRCFHERSRIFPDADDRERARALCVEKGVTLDSKQPLGYHDSQAAVVFEMRCPNNTLAVVWKEAPKWRALFPRAARMDARPA